MIPADSFAKKPSAKQPTMTRDISRLADAAAPRTPPSMNRLSGPRSSVFNETRRAILHSAPACAATPLSQAIGLMFARDAGDAGHCVVFAFSEPKRDAVSMFFVRDPIDILLLDGDSRVICMRERLLPWRVWLLPVRASYMVELPAGVIQSSKTVVGDTIVLPDPERCVDMWSLREYALFFAFQAGVFAILMAIAAGITMIVMAMQTMT